MRKQLLFFVKLLPDPLPLKIIKSYIYSQINKHAKVNVKGLENLNCDYKRPFLFVCNHLSNSDAIILNKVLEKENLIFIAGKKLASTSFTSLGLNIVRSISISQNSPDKDAIKKVVTAVKDGNNILIFPEGTRSRTSKMIEGKKGVLLISKLTHAPIVPVGIWGTEKLLPINEDMGKEVFFDADININIGEVFNPPKKSEEETKGDWEVNCLNHIMMKIADLLPKEYRGFYSDKT